MKLVLKSSAVMLTRNILTGQNMGTLWNHIAEPIDVVRKGLGDNMTSEISMTSEIQEIILRQTNGRNW